MAGCISPSNLTGRQADWMWATTVAAALAEAEAVSQQAMNGDDWQLAWYLF